MRFQALLLLFILCLASFADDGTVVSGPISGFVFDRQAQGIRPIMGFPGAAYLGAAMSGGLDYADVAPDGSAALMVRAGALSLLTSLKSGAPVESAIEGAIGNVDRIVWSDAATAAVYSSPGGKAQILHHLSGTPEAGAVVDLTGVTGVLSLAIAGDSLLVGSTGGVYRASPGGVTQVMVADKPAAILVSGQDLYVADRGANKIWQVLRFADEATPVVFADGVAEPAAIWLSADGKQLFVASAGIRSLDVYDVSSRSVAIHLELDFTPEMLRPVGEKTVLALHAPDENTPLYVLDAANPAVYFVPAGREQ